MYIHMSINMQNGIKVHYAIASALFAIIFFISFSSAACTENWQCFSWQKCSENFTSRQCFDVNTCGTSFLKPMTYESCSQVFSHCYDNKITVDETDIDCGGKCNPCAENNFCLNDEDCQSLYCLNGKCSLKIEEEQPAIIPIGPAYAYGIFMILILSLILIVIIVIQVEKLIPAQQSVDLSDYIQKARKGDLAIEDSGIPAIERKEIRKQLKKLDKKQRKEAENLLIIDNMNVQLPSVKHKQQKSESAEELKKAKKRRILKDIKTVYEYSYE